MDEATQKLVAYRGHIHMEEQQTTIWMDGRPHPQENALHTWSGFSTGQWDGDTLVVTTTHLLHWNQKCGVVKYFLFSLHLRSKLEINP